MDIVVEGFYMNFQEQTRYNENMKLYGKKKEWNLIYSNKIIFLMNTKVE